MDWKHEALKDYFRSRPGIGVDTVDIMSYFEIESILNTVDDLLKEGWLVRNSHPVYPQIKQAGE